MGFLLKRSQKLISYNKNSFPKKSNFIKTAVILLLSRVSYALKNRKGLINPFHIQADNLALHSWRMFAPINPIHYGEWLKLDNKYTPSLSRYEREFIDKSIVLFRGKTKNYTGLITSGVSEGNILSIYLIKEKLSKVGAKKICLLATQLTHISIFKASEMVNLDVSLVELDKSFGMSINSLEKNILKLKKKKYDAFIISLTLGYKITGSRDDYKKIFSRINYLSKKISTLNIKSLSTQRLTEWFSLF